MDTMLNVISCEVTDYVKTIYHGLEARMELDKEWRLLGQGKHPLLDHGAVDIVILDDDVLLEDLDRVQLVSPLPLSQHHLGKIIILYFIKRVSVPL